MDGFEARFRDRINLLSVFPGGVTRRAAVNCRRTLMEKERCRVKTHAKTHGLRRFLCGLTALATAALMVPLSAMATGEEDPEVVSSSSVSVVETSSTPAEESSTPIVEIETSSTSTEESSTPIIETVTSSTPIEDSSIPATEIPTATGEGFSVNGTTITVVNDPDTDDEIQNAINYIGEQENKTGWTINVAPGTYNRFAIPNQMENITINGTNKETVINVNDGSDLSVSVFGSDLGGLTLWGTNITINNITFNSEGQPTGEWVGDAAISTAGSNAGLASNNKLTISNCAFIGAGETESCYAVLICTDRFDINNCTFLDFSGAIEMMVDNSSSQDCQIVDNTITNCYYAIHGYWGNGSVPPEYLKITGNHIYGDGNANDNTSAYTVVTLTDNLNAGALKVDIHDNTFSYAIVGGLELEGDVKQGSLEALLETNNFINNSFVVDARLDDAMTGYTDIRYYAPKIDGKIATWYADPLMDAPYSNVNELVADIEDYLKEYGSAGQFFLINPDDHYDYSLAKNALVIGEYVDAGSLSITKQVVNQTEDYNYTFTIQFITEDNIPLKGRYEYSINGARRTVNLADGRMTVTLKSGQTVTIHDMLPGTKFTVTEDYVDSDCITYYQVGESVNSTSATGAIVENQTINVTVTNSWSGTGIDPNPPIIPDTPTIPDDGPSISIRKVWVEDTDEIRPDAILVEIYHDNELYDTIEIEERYNWRTSYDIPERYENDDWWVQEADVPAGYEDYIDETRDNVFVITNTYVGVEEESSEESSEPSVTPSEPSVTPSEPSSEPVSEPEEPAEPTLPQTGQVWWPIIILLAGGAVLVAFGAFRTMRGSRRHDR